MVSGLPLTGIDPTFDYIVTLFGPSIRKRDFSPTHQYESFEAMREDYKRRGTITVNTAHSERTIFATPDINAQFRYWHDMAHIATNADFSPEGERAAAKHQMLQVFNLNGPSDVDKMRWCSLIDAEVNGQTAYYMEHGDFPKDQRAFAVEYLRTHGYWDVDSFPRNLDNLIVQY